MLPGVVPFPPEYAQRYRERGYWRDRSLAQEFAAIFTQYAERIALIDGPRSFTYGDIDQLSTNLALNLLSLGLRPLDRVVTQLPNSAEFVILHFALQKIGAIPIAALPTHRYAEIRQFAELSAASACVVPERIRDFDFVDMLKRVQAAVETVRYGLVLGEAQPGAASLTELIEQPPNSSGATLARIAIDPTDPAVFQLSGGTTGIPKLIPRTHNDYAYNSKVAAEVCEVKAHHTLLIVLPIAHNLPLACPGLQGFFFQGARVVVSSSTRPNDIAREIERNRVTHLKVVPALLIRFLNDASITRFDLSSLESIQSGGQRLQPEVRLQAKRLIPSAFIRENFGMGEGLLTFVRRDDPQEVQLETVGRPVSPDDEVRITDEDGNNVPFGEVGEMWCRGPYTLRGYYGVPEYNARAFSPDGFYKSGDLMRQHPSGSFIVEGRKKDLINRGGEKISAEEIENIILSHPAIKNVACIAVPDTELGERMCACVQLRDGMQISFEELKSFLAGKEIAKFKLPEYLEVLPEFPLSSFGKVSKKQLVETIAAKLSAKSSSATV
jgi:2,3-dihydroxybenzoate-AMP ligase